MKKNIRLLKSMPVIVWVCLLFFMFTVLLKIAGYVAANSAADMQYEYYDVGYSYRTAVIEATEETKAVIEADRAFLESLPEGEEKEGYVRFFNKKYEPYGVKA